MTLANSFAAKLAVAFVATAMALTLMAPAANAQTEAELQAQIDQLLATIASLQAQVDGDSGSASCSYTFTRDLSTGSTGPEVMELQKFLNTDPETRVAASGVGSAGMETNYFGALTAAAVSKFQVKYRTDVLTPVGLVNPTGYWGSSSRAKANALCTADAGTGDEGDEGDESSEDLNGGEASLEDYDATSGDESEPAEGEEDVPVMDVEFDVEDGDVSVNRIDVAVDPGSSTTEDDPWDVFEEISIWVDGDKIADVDASDEDEWSDNDPETGDYTIRMSGLDWVVREGDTAEFTVAVSVAGSVDDAGDSTKADWDIFIPKDGIRAEDGVGIQNYTGESADAPSDAVNIDIDEQGGDDELHVSTSSDDPDATTLQLDDDNKSDWTTIHAFDLDTDDSVNDIEIDNLYANLAIAGGSTYDQIISDVRLMVDGEEYDDWSFATGTTGSSTVDFNFDIDGDLVIDAGDEVTVEMQVEFKALNSSYAGDTVTGSVTSANVNMINAEGTDDLDNSSPDQLTGSSQGETHTIRSSGVVLDFVSSSETFVENNDASTTDNEGTFVIKFDVTAFEDDVYFEKTTARGTTTSDSAVNYILEDSNGDETEAGTVDAVLTSTAPTEGSHFRVDEGETETFTLTVEYDPATSGFYSLQLDSVEFDEGSASGQPDNEQDALPAEDYESDPLSI